jgi:hypothetical protein
MSFDNSILFQLGKWKVYIKYTSPEIHHNIQYLINHYPQFFYNCKKMDNQTRRLFILNSEQLEINTIPSELF